MNEADFPATPSAITFPTIPSTTLDRLFSSENLRKLQLKAKSLNTESLPLADCTPCAPSTDEQDQSLQHFESLMWKNLDGLEENKVEFVREHMGKLHQLYYRVNHVGGYWNALGNGLWDYFDKEIISGAKDIYENYLSCIDPHLQNANWPLWKLKRTVVLPSFPLPAHPKPLRSLLSLPCFRLSSLPSILNLSTWCSSTLQIAALSNPCEICLTPQSHFELNPHFPIICLNTGSCICASEVECEDGGIRYVHYHPGEILGVQKGKVSIRCVGECEGKIKWLYGIIPNASRIISLLETTISDSQFCTFSLYSAVFDLLQTDMSATLSLSSQAILAEKLLSELADFPFSCPAELATVSISVCSLCHKSLFCLGRQCHCALIVCKRCRYLSHSCAQPSWSWVQVTDFRDLSLVRKALVSIQKRHLQSIRRN